MSTNAIEDSKVPSVDPNEIIGKVYYQVLLSSLGRNFTPFGDNMNLYYIFFLVWSDLCDSDTETEIENKSESESVTTDSDDEAQSPDEAEEKLPERGPSGYLRTAYTMDKEIMYQNVKGEWVYCKTGALVNPPLETKDPEILVAKPPVYKRLVFNPEPSTSNKRMSKFL